MIEFAKAGPGDAPELVAVQVRTFDDDSRRFGNASAGGPPGYDSEDWQIERLKDAFYYKILNDRAVIGGVIVFQVSGDHFELGRIFVDPSFQDRGIGAQALRFLEQEFPGARRWTLGTPNWAVRNHRFYEKAGFTKTGEEGPSPEGFVEFRYQKSMPIPRGSGR